MVASWKEQIVKEIASDFKKYHVAGVVGISGIPSKQFQDIRKTLRGDVKIIITRRRLIHRAMKKAKITGLEKFVEDSVGLVFTDLDPFQLEKRIYSCKTTASAKPGQITPVDIVVEEGDTGLPAGPVIGEIQHAGIKAKIDGGKIVIMQKSVVAKAGEEVPEEAAPVLKRLGIEPIEISLELKGVFDGKTVYTAEVLHIDSTEVFNQFTQAHQKAFNLAYNVGYFTKDTLPLLLQKAFIESVNLALNAEIINKETLPTFLVKADTQAKALKALIPEEIKETEKKEAKPEEPAKEEKAKKTETKETEPEDKKEEKVKDKAEEKAVDEAKPEDVESKTEKTEKSVKEKKEEPKKEESQAE